VLRTTCERRRDSPPDESPEWERLGALMTCSPP
jgi:hypothetical protein